VVLAGAYSTLAIVKPFAELTPSVTKDTLTITTPPSNVPWPSYGQGAFGLANGKVIATHGEQTPVAIASVAKVINALVVLDRHPLAAGASGPTITLTDRDVSLYDKYIAIDGSVMPVRSGMKLTERQMLEALLLPSANNIADSLAIWAFGSIGSYKTYATAYLQRHDLIHTTVGNDASGYLPDSTSTASDLVKLGALAMSNSVIAEIVSQKTATIPNVGTVRNYNYLLGTNGINGIKTGNNDQNGGVFVGSTTAQVNGKTVTLISALSGAPNLSTVLRDSGSLLATIRTTFAETNIVKKGTVLGTYAQTDGSRIQAVAGANLSLTVLRGDTVTATITLDPINYSTARGQTIGHVSVTATDFSPAVSVPIVLNQAPTKPSLTYRLLHP
jgi:D-alanyl-D-alanine carboxypeptidase (penicillin-binding protein 5/6)